MRAATVFWIAAAALLLGARLAHTTILWADEDYHLAAAIQILHGKMLYRDLWYDKPPLGALAALAWGAFPGWPLRLASTLIATANCLLAFRFAARLWTPREGYAAAGLLAFYQIFYFASSTIPVEPDTLLILPHLAAVYLAWQRRPFAAGVAAGCAFLLTPKGAFVLAACLLFHPAGWLALAAGFLLPNAAAAAWLLAQGALSSYLDQVWRWGLLYTRSPMPGEAAATPLLRLLSWIVFHAGLVLAAAVAWRVIPNRRLRTNLALWLLLSLAAAALGWRLLPRYLNQILPPLAILAAAGAVRLYDRRRFTLAAVVLILLAAFPVVRFGPRYITLALEGATHTWTDVRMDQESRAAAAIVRQRAQPGDTIFVWGYRPNVVAYTRLPVASALWESQPLTGVPADRHLSNADPLDAAWAARNRAQVVRSAPTFIVDGLSRYNPRLDIHNYPELAAWMENYCRIGEDGGTIVYRRCRPSIAFAGPWLDQGWDF